MKRKAKKIADNSTNMICNMGEWGFSHLHISKSVFGSKHADKQRRRVSYTLRKNGILVTDYRKGKNNNAKGIIDALSRKVSILEKIQVHKNIRLSKIA